MSIVQQQYQNICILDVERRSTYFNMKSSVFSFQSNNTLRIDEFERTRINKITPQNLIKFQIHDTSKQGWERYNITILLNTTVVK